MVAESMCRVGGRVLKMKLMLSQLSTKMELKLKLKLSLAILSVTTSMSHSKMIANYLSILIRKFMRMSLFKV